MENEGKEEKIGRGELTEEEPINHGTAPDQMKDENPIQLCLTAIAAILDSE